MSGNAKLKLCLAASSGGHLSQLQMLEKAWENRDFFFAVTGFTAAKQLQKKYGVIVYSVPESNRKRPLRLLAVLAECLKIILRERPDVVISTGAAHGCLLALFGKMLRAKVVWVDSVANVERISLSGRIVRHFADLFLVQWRDVAKRYHGVVYCGELI